LRCLAMFTPFVLPCTGRTGAKRQGGEVRGTPPPGFATLAILPLKGRMNYLIACGLIGEPVPPVMTSGGPQKKNS